MEPKEFKAPLLPIGVRKLFRDRDHFGWLDRLHACSGMAGGRHFARPLGRTTDLLPDRGHCLGVSGAATAQLDAATRRAAGLGLISVEATKSHFVEDRHNSDEGDNGVNCGHWIFHL